eukprot:CAMPEP_0194333180 /NCGR_PEP_ID=MMETSP0171-20130528/61838_1 /TAXON_ID=218684 /ORGANISM="Corethron pennatum, Strain L29A3" /LENGTH=107 /DNA_ID=CAMNT_0039095323 /DNA_START=346 /DNA_END=666 /DNA_ORIENTATION=-
MAIPSTWSTGRSTCMRTKRRHSLGQEGRGRRQKKAGTVAGHAGLVGRDVSDGTGPGWGGEHGRPCQHGAGGLRRVLLRRAEPVPVPPRQRDGQQVDDRARQFRSPVW